MSTDLMIDEARKRFESQKFPDTITPFYIGQMTNICSLGRIAMGYSAPNLPIKQISLDIDNILFETICPNDSSPDLQGCVAGHFYKSKYELEENISAMRLNFLFFDAFGNTTGECFYSLVSDIPKGEWENSDIFCYGNVNTARVAPNKNITVIDGLEAKNYNLCLFGISAVRTTDGVLYEQDTKDFLAMTEWVMPKK